jgi:hypothetical protein
MAEKARRLPPVTHDDKDGAQRQKLTYLDPDIEGNQVDEQAIGEISNSLILVARPKPWKKPKISVAIFVLG